jgi:hypothetical protein
MSRLRTLFPWLPLALCCGCVGGISTPIEGVERDECLDGLDNDGDAMIDCDDVDCAGWDVCGGADDDDDTVGPDDDDDTAGSEWDVCINEFMASNSLTIPDETGAYPDWIELHDLGGNGVDLDGWSISDNLDNPEKHGLGAVTIPAGGYLLLWADSMPELGERHLSFSLTAEGEELGLYRPDGSAVNTLQYEQQVTDWSAARMPDGSLEWVIDETPTPGQEND